MSERCGWAGSEPIYADYHDTEWGGAWNGTAAHYGKSSFLTGFRRGLSWITILKKRDNFREAFAGFDPQVIATWGEKGRRTTIAKRRYHPTSW